MTLLWTIKGKQAPENLERRSKKYFMVVVLGINCPVHLWLRKMVVSIKDACIKNKRIFKNSPKELVRNISQKPTEETKFTKFMIILKPTN